MKDHPDVATKGLEGLPEEMRRKVRDLAWFYDNLGVHDVAAVSGKTEWLRWPRGAPVGPFSGPSRHGLREFSSIGRKMRLPGQ
jgi:hypothetical protein